ncbi:MAG TPA: YtxH domain-containing protein [Bryobacteraceae bacterium]|jgi:gas vesicle protein
MDEDSKLGYFFLGLGVGVAVGLLFAPKTGEETRRLIRDRASDSGDYLKKQSSDLRNQASDLLDKSKDTLAKHRESIASAVEAGKQAYRDTVTGAD